MKSLLTSATALLAFTLFFTGSAPHQAQAYSCNSRYYTNSEGIRVHSPSCKSGSYTAICRDGSYSQSRHHRGTCSRHGGVASWR